MVTHVVVARAVAVAPNEEAVPEDESSPAPAAVPN